MSNYSPQGRSGRGLNLSVLDALRGLAALYVVLHHARWFLWVSQRQYIADGGHGLGLVAAELSAGFVYGPQAVLLFFVLSGFCIHYRQAKSLVDNRESGRGAQFSPLSFGWRRVRRLYPTLLFALVLTTGLDHLGMLVNPDFYAGHASAPTIQAAMAIPDYSLLAVIGNTFMQGGLAVPQLGTNVPLWSLAYETWFYLLYPALLWLSLRLHALGMIVVVGTVSLVALVFPQLLPVPAWLLPALTYWVVWAMGALSAEIYVGRLRVRGLRWLALLSAFGAVGLLALVALSHATESLLDRRIDLLLGVAFAVLLTYAMVELPRRFSLRTERVAGRLAWLGDLSYSLYIVHYPWLALVSAWWLTQHDRLPEGAELVVLGTASAVILAWCCWFLVERHSVSTRKLGSGRRPARTNDAPWPGSVRSELPSVDPLSAHSPGSTTSGIAL